MSPDPPPPTPPASGVIYPQKKIWLPGWLSQSPQVKSVQSGQQTSCKRVRQGQVWI